MNSLKPQHLPVLFILLLLFSCKKNRPVAKKILEPEVPGTTKIFIPVKFESTGAIINLKYKKNTALLTEIEDIGGIKTVITYTNDSLLFKLEKYKNEKLFYVVYYEKDHKKNMRKGIVFDYDHLLQTYTPKGFYGLDYNDEQQLTSVKYHDPANKLTRACARSYTPAGNISEMSILDYPAYNQVIRYNFDQKKGISAHIIYNSLFALESEHWFMSCSHNNVLSYNNQKLPVKNVSFSYEYNESGYPSKMTITQNKNIQDFKITYALVP